MPVCAANTHKIHYNTLAFNAGGFQFEILLDFSYYGTVQV